MENIQAINISLPKGGGAIKSLGESFQPNAFSGAASYSVPIPLTPARGFEPQLSLNYSSGGGNDIFGMGFSLSLPKISRKTETGIPTYSEKDTYILLGEGELTPELIEQNDQWVLAETTKSDGVETWTVLRFLPREINSFSLIELWRNPSSGDAWWKVISRNNVTSHYGKSQNARIADPEDETKVFEWLIEESFDSKGNKILYHYKSENGKNISNRIYEINRSFYAKKYIRAIQYGPYIEDAAAGTEKFAFEVVFDYGEYDLPDDNSPDSNPYKPVAEWKERADPFSNYRSGFEIRTFRLCRNILIFHNFKELGKNPCLVKALQLIHDETPSFSFLKSITQAGYRINEDGSYASQSLPPLDFEYSQFSPPEAPEFRPLLVNGMNTIPGYLDSADFNPIDLKGEGLPGLFFSNEETAFYYEPLGDGDYMPPSVPASFPITRNLQNPSFSLQSLEANGEMELVVNSAQMSGYFSQEYAGRWSAYQNFQSIPTDITNPYRESVDLDGNGKADLLTLNAPDLVFYASKGKVGYDEPRRVPLPQGFPVSVNYGECELVTFANIFGDGLSHRVKIRDGSVEVYPNLGYGHFGEKVTLGNSPRFDSTTTAARIFLADVDGSGTTDLVFAYADRVDIFLNQAGNSFAEKSISIALPGGFSDIDQIQFADILGEGTSALVLTKAGSTMSHWYYNFCGERAAFTHALKPYLLTKVENNLGAATEIFYASSTKFYLEDKKAGRPRVTRLPFPVQVVEKTVATDKISGSCLTSAYKYHDGYFDPVEREFRGFGFVESWDTETFEEYQKSVSNPAFPSERLSKELYVPPVYTKTWHHTGAYIENKVITKQYEQEYFQDDKDAYDFPDSVFDSSIFQSDAETVRQAYAALKGTMMRQEVYALDNSSEQENPYSVNETNVSVELIQPTGNQRYAVFQVNPRESISYHYERNPKDPRMQQAFTLEVDPLSGEIIKACTVFLPRRKAAGSGVVIYPEQHEIKATATFNNYINTSDTEAFRYRGILYQAQEFEIFGLDLKGSQYFSYDDLLPVKSVVESPIPYQGTITPAELQARQLSWSRRYFYNKDQKLGEISSPALMVRIDNAVFTREFITGSFGARLTDDTIAAQGGYFFDDATGYWWNRGLTQSYIYDRKFFYVPSQTENPFVEPSSPVYSKTIFEYDSPYFLSPVKVTRFINEAKQIENVITAEIDYIALQPYQLVDINGNVSQCLFDPLGQVLATTLFGTENGISVGGMRLYPYNGQAAEYKLPTDATFEKVLDNSKEYLSGAASFFYYDLFNWKDRRQPSCSIDLVRDDFYQTSEGVSDFSCKTLINYSDGFGRQMESKLKTDSGVSIVHDADGKLVSGKNNKPLLAPTDDRWVVSGRTVYNNKGEPCEQYLPYFTDTPLFEEQQQIVDAKLVPPPSITHYDPLLRVIRIDTPKGFFSKVEFTPWEEKHCDEDDTVKDSTYYIDFMKNYPGKPSQEQIDEKDALDKAAVFYDTPAINVLDNLGNAFLNIQTLADKRQLISFSETDVQGRTTLLIDPRLYNSNQTQKTDYYNFKYRYAMDDKDPLYIDSVDAGIEKHLSNIFGNQLWSLSPRNYCQLVSYDALQRRSALQVKKVEDDQPILSYDDFNLVEVFTYGEMATDAQKNNLRGQLYQLNDLSGIVKNSQYSLAGEMLETSRQMTTVYNKAIDWKSVPPPPLETEIYPGQFTYNALGHLITETTPDGSVTTNGYNLRGFLNQVKVTYKDKTEDAVINLIDYDANEQRTTVQYGNGITTNYAYESTTLRLTGLQSTRPKGAGTESVQNIAYTYDPVGNITRSWNKTFETVFNNNQKVEPLSQYTYDALYRLTGADGRQHPGINSDTYKNNISDNDFKQCLFSQLPNINDAGALENYSEAYTYDDSGNLINKRHIAVSSSWTRKTPVEDNSNRLKDLQYDASGNLRQLDINNTVKLSFNCCENLVSAGIIERPDELDDSDYYVYDSSEQRTRKVSERMAHGGAVTLIEEKTYLGSYEIKRNISVNAQGDKTVTMERQTLRVMDDSSCVLIVHYCAIGKEAGTRKLRFQMSDNLGSITSEYDKDTQLISYEEYFPYGGTAIIAGSNQAEVKLKDYRYSGKERDDSTGLYYYGARYYASWLGRWLNPDPSGTADGLNLYAFVGGNPITFIDYNGLSKKKPKGAKALANDATRKAAAAVAHTKAQWKAHGVKRTRDDLVVESWNTQDKNGRALAQFSLIRVPDVLHVQEAGSVPSGGLYNATTGVTTGSSTVKRKRYGYTDTISQTVYFAHVPTGSKNIMTLSIHPIENAHLIHVADPAEKGTYRFRTALATQVQEMNFVNVHLVSGVPKLAEKHLERVIEASEHKEPTLLVGDANMNADSFGRVSKKRKLETTVFLADTATQKSGGALDHGVFFKESKAKSYKVGSSSVLKPKGSDHNQRRFRLRNSGTGWKPQ
ncbi:MAG: SpvB/TcaC N-terminal domain-containing protein [Pyrinomonadaceae bacterium]